MKTRRSRLLLLSLALCLVAGVTLAQRFRSRDRDLTRPRDYTEGEAPPVWEVDRELPQDLYTFVRVRYSSTYRGSRSSGNFITDWPDADLNLSWRLQQLTSMKVLPNGKILELTDPDLFNYPFIYIVEPGGLEFSEEEVGILRRYLLNGGFLMVDDFWGEVQYANFYNEIKRVFPEREPVDLPMDHPIFHCVLPMNYTRPQMQVPNVRLGVESERTGVTWEYHDGEECRDVHFRGIFDDKNRMMVMICHNTDNGDGWEREGENHYYFKQFSERVSYPLMINILFYAMSH